MEKRSDGFSGGRAAPDCTPCNLPRGVVVKNSSTYPCARLATRNSQPGKYLPLATCHFLLFFLFSLLAAAPEAHAAGGLAFCDQQREAMPNQFIAPLVSCFTDPAQGLIPVATLSFMSATKAYYLTVVTAAATLLITLSGYKLLMGDYQNLKGDMFSMVFKIAGVFYFIDQAPTIYGEFTTVGAALNNTMAFAVQSAGPNLFCARPTLWASFDCIFAWMLGVGATVGVTALIGMLMLIMFSYGVGLVILFAVIYLMVTAFFSVLRFFQIYLMAFMAFSFMMALGYVFVPLLLFKNTFTYFQKWMTTCVAYLLVPVVMYGYMGMMLIALDVTLISGDFSVMREIFGPKAVTAMNADDPNTNPSTRIKCPVNGSNDGNGTFCNNNHKSVFSLGIATNATQIKTDGGVFGSLNDIGESATNFLSETHGNMIDAGFDYLEADVTEMALQQGENKTNEQYLIDVALSSCIASLIAYIMFSLMGYIPELASGLVSQGTHAGAHVAKAEVFGQATVMKSMDVAKQAAMAYFSGGGSLLKSAGGIAAKTMSRK